MKKLRILVAMHETLIPPDTLDGRSEREYDEWRTEYDVVSHLKQVGHDVRCIGLLDSLTELRTTIHEWRPDIVFNLLEEFGGVPLYEQHVVAFLELLRQPYTGCNPRGLMLSRDKVLSKQLLAYHRVPTPQFAVFGRAKRVHVPRRLRYPLFVKSATDDASLGIAQASVCDDEASLRERIQFVHDCTSSDALVEEYVPGREIYVGALGNDRITVLPVWELDFGALPGDQAPIATRKAKWDRQYQARHGIKAGPAKDLPDAVVARLGQLTRRIYRALHLTGCARMDFRLREDGAIFVLEANANPNMSEREDFARSALLAGTSYDDLLARLISLGLGYPAAWRASDT